MTAQLAAKLKSKRIASVFLPVSAAFHCSLLQPMCESFSEYLKLFSFEKSEYEVIRNLDTEIFTSKTNIVDGLTKQLINPVKFYQSIGKCIDNGVKQFIEVKILINNYIN